jgi:hypothetical protein
MNEMQFLLYESDEKIEVIMKDETIWATQKAIAGLFGVDRTSISRHLKNVFETGELVEEVVSANIAQTTEHGAIAVKTQTKDVKFYTLDAIISVGYRVNSQKAIGEYKEFNRHQKIVSDFDQEIRKIQEGGNE